MGKGAGMKEVRVGEKHKWEENSLFFRVYSIPIRSFSRFFSNLTRYILVFFYFKMVKKLNKYRIFILFL
jgi:hypothetical protein